MSYQRAVHSIRKSTWSILMRTVVFRFVLFFFLIFFLLAFIISSCPFCWIVAFGRCLHFHQFIYSMIPLNILDDTEAHYVFEVHPFHMWQATCILNAVSTGFQRVATVAARSALLFCLLKKVACLYALTLWTELITIAFKQDEKHNIFEITVVETTKSVFLELN